MQIQLMRFSLLCAVLVFMFRQPNAKLFLFKQSKTISHVKAVELMISQVNQLSGWLQASHTRFDQLAFSLASKATVLIWRFCTDQIDGRIDVINLNRKRRSRNRGHAIALERVDSHQCPANGSDYNWHRLDELQFDHHNRPNAWSTALIVITCACILPLICLRIAIDHCKHSSSFPSFRCLSVQLRRQFLLRCRLACSRSQPMQPQVERCTNKKQERNLLQQQIALKLHQNEREHERMQRLFGEAMDSYDRLLQRMQFTCHNLASQA
jgi:hypothetical protein